MRAKPPLSAKSVLSLLLASTAFIAAIAQQPSPKPAAPAATVPGFTVNITYSQKAMATLVAGKETVIVAGYLSGAPRKDTPRQYVSDMSEVGLGEAQREIAPGATATFDHIKLKQSMLKWIDSQGPLLLINVYSGRKSSPNNLLDCGIYEGALKGGQGQIIPISCKLIGE